MGVGLRDLHAKRPLPEEFGMRVTPGMKLGKSYGSKMSILPINQENEKKWRSKAAETTISLHNQSPFICNCLFSSLCTSAVRTHFPDFGRKAKLNLNQSAKELELTLSYTQLEGVYSAVQNRRESSGKYPKNLAGLADLNKPSKPLKRLIFCLAN